VPALVDKAAVPHFAHLVDAVRELEAAILDMDAGVEMGPVEAVDIGDAGHKGSQ
jgi:hypothetical protein